MVFSSNLFLFAFLPLFLVSYYLTPFKWRSPLILVFSLVFYGWFRPEFLGLLVGVVVGTYYLTLWMDNTNDETKKFRILSLCVALNLVALGYFKYWNFGVDSLNAALGAAGVSPIQYSHVILPIGLSFYIFQAISYAVDVYRKDAPVTVDLFDFAAFITYFPQLVAGPVLRYQPLADQFRHREHSWALFAKGSFIFMVGFCQKVLIADPMNGVVDAAFLIKNPSFIDAWVGTIAYTIQLFYDFCGYSTMAIGLALMTGFVFPENFNDPYISKSITEFWRRWHMSLSEWLRCYLYIPLGGNRLGSGRTYLNLTATMVLGGLWHGANWTFIVWGIWHGGILALERLWGEKMGKPLLPGWLAVIKTLVLVMIGWVFFRATNLSAAFDMLAGMAGLNGFAAGPQLMWLFTIDKLIVMIVGGIFVFVMPHLKVHGGGALRWAIPLLFIWAVATLSSQAFTPFLYFQF